jgi:hypothetical protein
MSDELKLACPQPGQAGTKKVIIHHRVRGVRREVFYFFYKLFTLRPLRSLRGKNILSKNGKNLLQGNLLPSYVPFFTP